MPRSEPQRPFVPHRTPRKGQPSARPSEFRVSKPFVPGTSSVALDFVGSDASTTADVPESVGLPGIERFLALEPTAVPPAAGSIDDYLDADFEEPDEVPPVEHFLDPLPPVSQFASENITMGGPAGTTSSDSSAPDSGATSGESNWVETDWQNYNWSAVAALGETGASEASNAWATTDWDVGGPRQNASRPTAAQAIASALDQIAERIRAGELVVPSAGKMSDPASLAAALAAMLGIRQ